MFTGKAQQLTIYVGESDTWHHQSAYAAILEMLRREGCGGATVTRGIAGFGATSVIHTTSRAVRCWRRLGVMKYPDSARPCGLAATTG